jgi:hypothetical protein
MRNQILTIVSSVAILALACGTPQQMTIQEATGRVEVSTPFSEAKFRTDKDYYRAFQSYKHPNENTARSFSAVAARAELLAQVKADISNFAKNFEAVYCVITTSNVLRSINTTVLNNNLITKFIGSASVST